jgi:hypothetical protein
MADIEKLITPIIESQFPSFYKEEGPMFIEFVKAYYEWLEQSNNTINTSKSLLEYRDIDRTVDDFIIHFKNKYIPLIKFDTSTDKRRIIKSALDLYRSKGTERSVDLFFRLVFGVPAEVYFPAKDIFRLSANEWVKPRYLELDNTKYNKDYVGKLVVGVTSGATAFCENYVRKKLSNKYIDVLYISSIDGDFITGEKVIYDSLSPEVAPIVIGSLNTLDVFSGGDGFSIGDLVTLESDNGIGAKARVANVSNITGVVNFDLVDGGWGFTANAQVYVSTKVLGLSNANADINNTSNQTFYILETVTQPQAQIQYEIANGTFANGDTIYAYNSGASPSTAIGLILQSLPANSTAGNLFVVPVSGNLQINTVFSKAGNTVGATTIVSGYTDTTANGKIVGNGSNLTISFEESNVFFSNSVSIFQTNTSGFNIANATVFNTSIIGSNGSFTTRNAKGVFRPGAYNATYSNGLTVAANGTLTQINMTIGVANLTGGDLTSLPGNYIYGTQSNTYANISSIGQGSLATFAISNTLSRAEQITVYTDLISTYKDVALNASTYGFPGNTAANLTFGILDDIFTTATANVGGITRLVSINPGENYNLSPFVYIYEPVTAPFQRQDYFLTFENASGSYAPNEVITQAATGAEGVIRTANSTVMHLKRTTFFTDFVTTSNSTTIIVGSDSGVTANVVFVEEDLAGLSAGENAIISVETQTANGSVNQLEVVDSGFGYLNNEAVTFISSNGLRSGTAQGNLIKQGQSEGYFETGDSFLSSDKRLFDGDYYQEYSYDIRVSKTLDKYSDIFKNTIHVAGTKFFGTLIAQQVNDTKIGVIESGAPIIS